MRRNSAISTDHATRQAARRGIAPEQVGLALQFGREFHRNGLLFRSIGRREIEQYFLEEGSLGLTAVLSPDGRVLVTAYKNPNAISEIRKKSERGWRRGRKQHWSL